MRRTVRLVRIFVASPDDVATERASLERVIDEINMTWARTAGMHLEFVKWETHTYPGVGSNAQEVINRQLADDYEVFIGILGTRFGTETGRAGSGTEEEFDRAYSRWEANPESVRIMFYLKDAPVRPSEIDVEQYAKVLKFRERLKNQGVLYRVYEDVDDFPNRVRLHLGMQGPEIEQLFALNDASYSTNQAGVSTASEQTVVGGVQAEDDDLGFLELIELSSESFVSATELAQRFTEAMNYVGQRAESRNAELQDTQSSAGAADIPRGRRVINRMADDMEQFVATTGPIVPVLAGMLKAGFDAAGRAAIIWTDFQNDDKGDIEETLENVRSLRESIESSFGGLATFRATVATLPRMTTPFNRARRSMLTVLDSYTSEMTGTVDLAHETQVTLQRIVAGEAK